MKTHFSEIGKVIFDRLNWVRNKIDDHQGTISEIIIQICFILLLVTIGCIIYDYVTYHSTNYVYDNLFNILIIVISLLGVSLINLSKRVRWISDWIRDKTHDSIETTLWIVFAIFLMIMWWIVCDCFTCDNRVADCEYKNFLQLSMAILGVLGSGLISVVGALYEGEERRRKETIAIESPDDILRRKLFRQNEKVLKLLTKPREDNPSRISTAEPQEFSEIFDIFIDASMEDTRLINQVTGCLEDNTINYLSPIGFRDSEINVIKVLEARLKSCTHVIIVCGNTNLMVWAKNRLKFYDKLASNMGKQLSIFPKIFVFHTDDVQFDQQRNPSVQFINYSKDQEVIQCNQLVSLIKEKTGKSS